MSVSDNPWANQPANAPADDFSDLDNFGGTELRAQHAFKSTIETLPDGTYDFEITAAVLDRTKDGDRILRMDLRVLGGAVVEWACWLNKQTSVNALCADLVALGFDADKWGPARPLSVELPRAVVRLKGLKFRATKSSRKDSRPGMGDKVYHDLRVACRLDGRPMPPLTPPVAGAPTPATPPPTNPPQHQFSATIPGNPADIPF